jgi:hypothetical protein
LARLILAPQPKRVNLPRGRAPAHAGLFCGLPAVLRLGGERREPGGRRSTVFARELHAFSLGDIRDQKWAILISLHSNHEENPMQDLIQHYVSDLHKLREVFYNELEATSEELSKAMALYAKRCDAALASFMEKASARERELEASAAARLDQFCGLTDVDKGPLTQTPTHAADAGRIAERAVAHSLHAESDRDRKAQPSRSMTLVKSGPAASNTSSPAAAE